MLLLRFWTWLTDSEIPGLPLRLPLRLLFPALLFVLIVDCVLLVTFFAPRAIWQIVSGRSQNESGKVGGHGNHRNRALSVAVRE
jgi:hypothetical protein